MSEVKNVYTNQAFINPYAISTDDLTVDRLKKPQSPDSKGFDGHVVEESNPHYEDTSEVLKKAGLSNSGLTGTGRRRKENIIYEETVSNKKDKTSKPKATRKRDSELPPRPNEDGGREAQKRSNNWKIPFAILCVLVLLAIIGGALGVLAYFDGKECSCDATPYTSTIKGEANTSALTSNTRTIAQLTEKLIILEKEIGTLKAEQKKQSNLHQKLNTSVDKIDSALNTKLTNVNSSVLALTKNLNLFDVNLRNTDNFTQQLNSKISYFNSTFSIQLRNISKQQGPRGSNGSEGIPGPHGVGNFSLCEVKTEEKKEVVNKIAEKLTKTLKSVPERLGYKIMGAVCTTAESYGAGQTVLSITKPNNNLHPYTYTCTCVGVSTFGELEPQEENGKKYIKCIIHYLECPIIT